VLSPTSIGFGSQNTGTASAAQTITLSNPGTAALTISSIVITGVSASSFRQTNTCGTTLAVNASCIILVTFTPQVVGALTAAITVTDNASGSPQSAALSGTGTVPPVPQAVLTPASLVFASQLLNTTSAAQTITLSNPGTATLTIASVSITSSSSSIYATTTTCGATLAASATCTISVTFTPAVAGTLVAAISVADNAGGSPQSVALSGTGTNPATFSLAATPATQSVNPGDAANFTVQISSLGGTFAGAVTLGVTGLPAGSSATFSATSITPGSTGATSVLTIQTASQNASLMRSRIPGAPMLAVLLLPPAWWIRRRHRPGRLPLAMLLLFFICLGLSSCGGGYFGPAPRSFTLTVTGAADSIQQSTTVTLNVQ
jgi:trimeric autotransporter adhesin